jgi:hypothetical protein
VTCYICAPEAHYPAAGHLECDGCSQGCDDCFTEFSSALVAVVEIDGEPVPVFRAH